MPAPTTNQDHSRDAEWQQLCSIAAAVGRDTGLVQGAGGNVSLKSDATLRVKASGKWLADAELDDIFVPLSLECARSQVASDSEDFSSCLLDNATLKPSIETGMHAVLPHRVVLHVHSVNVLSYAVLECGKEQLRQRLGGIPWRWIPYCRPGAPLTCAVRAAVEVASGTSPLALVLGNHGLVVAADSIDGVMSLLNAVEDALRRPARTVEVDAHRAALERLAIEVGAKLPLNDAAIPLAVDTIALQVAAMGALYPDHVVFLGAMPAIRSQDEMKHFSWADCDTPYVIVRDLGVLARTDISANAEAMLGCWADLALRIADPTHISPLTESSILELTGWDAERYRQSLARAQHPCK